MQECLELPRRQENDDFPGFLPGVASPDAWRLCERVDAQGYDRIVIVAHSQGTVITTELLRYMSQRARVCRWMKVSDPDAILGCARIELDTRLPCS